VQGVQCSKAGRAAPRRPIRAPSASLPNPVSPLREQGPSFPTGLARARQGTGHRAQGTGHRAQGTGHRAQGTGHRAQGTGHRAQGTGHRAQGTGKWEQVTGAASHGAPACPRGGPPAVRPPLPRSRANVQHSHRCAPPRSRTRPPLLCAAAGAGTVEPRLVEGGAQGPEPARARGRLPRPSALYLGTQGTSLYRRVVGEGHMAWLEMEQAGVPGGGVSTEAGADRKHTGAEGGGVCPPHCRLP